VSALLEVRGLVTRFGERQILDVAALDLDNGRHYVLTGGNGAGKSTLLRVLAGLQPADVQAFRYAGKAIDLARYPRWLRHEIVYVHQHPYLFNTSVAANFGYGLAAQGVARGEREPRVRAAIEWAGVAHLLRVPPWKLSGGEKQRVALARAWVVQPRVLLLDEPTANLDAEARGQVLELLQEIARGDTCVVVACHDREIIDMPYVEVLHLEGGRLVAPLRRLAGPGGVRQTPRPETNLKVSTP